MTWTRLTVHWIVSDCDLRKVSVYKQGLCRVKCCTDYTQVLEETPRAYVLSHKGRGAISLRGIRLQQ